MYGYPYFNQPQKYQPMENFNQQITTPQFVAPIQQPSNQLGLLGKSVDSIDVVKAMDIPLDGSVSYFPLTDGSAIVTKKLQKDGTSKTVIYRPVEQEKENGPRYITIEELREELESIDLSELEDLKDLKDEIKNLKKEIKDIKTKKNRED